MIHNTAFSCISLYYCCMHFVELSNLQVALCTLVGVRIGARDTFSVWVKITFRLGSGLGQEFANGACAISKLAYHHRKKV